METCLKINTILILKARPKVDIITPRVSVSVYNGNAATNPPNTAPTSSFDRDYWQQVVPPPLGTCLVGSDDGDDIDIEKERERERERYQSNNVIDIYRSMASPSKHFGILVVVLTSVALIHP